MKVNNLAPLKNFAKKYEGTPYGKAAQKAFDKLSADLSLKMSTEKFL